MGDQGIIYGQFRKWLIVAWGILTLALAGGNVYWVIQNRTAAEAARKAREGNILLVSKLEAMENEYRKVQGDRGRIKEMERETAEDFNNRMVDFHLGTNRFSGSNWRANVRVYQSDTGRP